MSITALMVKELRQKTGAGMMNCKKALTETNGDFEAAIDWLKTKRLALAAKKSNRIATKGLTAIAIDGIKGSAIEINSETDFVARNKTFQNLVSEVAKVAVNHNNLESLKLAKTTSGKTITEEIIANIANIGENLNLRRMQTLSISDGIIASYVHNSSSNNLGEISVLIALESSGDKEKLGEIGKQLAMHVAASKPQSLNREGVDPLLIQREKDIFIAQARDSGKPDNIIEKMIEGRISKLFKEIVLLDQEFIIDGKTKISDVIVQLAKTLKTTVKLKDFIRIELGEGIEKEKAN